MNWFKKTKNLVRYWFWAGRLELTAGVLSRVQYPYVSGEYTQYRNEHMRSVMFLLGFNWLHEVMLDKVEKSKRKIDPDVEAMQFGNLMMCMNWLLDRWQIPRQYPAQRAYRLYKTFSDNEEAVHAFTESVDDFKAAERYFKSAFWPKGLNRKDRFWAYLYPDYNGVIHYTTIVYLIMLVVTINRPQLLENLGLA